MQTPVSIATRGAVLVAVVLVVIQLSGALHPVDLVDAGLRGDGAQLMVEDFGPERIPDDLPFDGQYIYVTARLLPDWDAINGVLQESSYRLARILHPLLASPAGSGVPLLILLQAWNVVGVWLLVWALANLLERYGHPPTWAWAGAPACMISLLFTTSEPLAFGLAMAGVAMADRGQLAHGASLLALGALTRESALTCALAMAALLWTRRQRLAAPALLIGAAVPFVAWWLYVQSVTPYSRTPLEVFGFLKLFDQRPGDIAASLITLALMLISVVAWWDVPPFRWVTLAFVAWLPIYEGFGFRLVGLPRLSLVSVALGIAGVARWSRRTRTNAPQALAFESG